MPPRTLGHRRPRARPVFIGAIGLITHRLSEGRALYVDALGLPLRRAKGARFLYSTKLGGGRYFGVWPLSEAARVCFGSQRWPARRPVPQLFIELEMPSPAAVRAAASELESRGYPLLHGARVDAWGQTVARLQTKEGLLIGISYVPWMHRRPKRRKSRPRRAGSGARGSGGRRGR